MKLQGTCQANAKIRSRAPTVAIGLVIGLGMSAVALSMPMRGTANLNGAEQNMLEVAGKAGVPIAQLLAWDAVAARDLVARSLGGEGVELGATVARPNKEAKATPRTVSEAVPVQALNQLPPMPAQELVQRVRQGRMEVPKAAFVQSDRRSSTLIRQQKSTLVSSGMALDARLQPETNGEKTVRVTIDGGSNQTPAAVVAPAPAPTADVKRLRIKATPKGLDVAPLALVSLKGGDVVEVEAGTGVWSDLNLFVRDQNIAELRWQNQHATLRAVRAGATELYIVRRGHMHIVPVTVSDSKHDQRVASHLPQLQVPAALSSLEGVFAPALDRAMYGNTAVAGATSEVKNKGAQRAPVSEIGTQSEADEPGVVGDGKAMAEQNQPASLDPVLVDHGTTPSLQASVEDTAKAMLSQARAEQAYVVEQATMSYAAATIQLIDERSRPEAKLIYPVAKAKVHVIGTEFTGTTDATGHLAVRDLPKGSRFLLDITDQEGHVRAAVAELAISSADAGVQRIRMMRAFAFDADAAIAGAVQNANLGSYCVTITDRGSGGSPRSEISVQADISAEGPFYFNRYGFLDRAQRATGPDGRACYFNVPSGPWALSLYAGGDLVATLPVAAFVGRHVEDSIDIGDTVKFQTRLATMMTAQVQLGSDQNAAASLKEVDMIDLIPLGEQSPMMQAAPGMVTTNDPLLPHHGRLRALAQAAEFEPTLYHYEAGESNSITPLVPRGFVEDMALYAQVTHDPALGTVLAEFSSPKAVGNVQVAMRLVDQFGRDVGDGWYFSDTPTTKAIFFNIPYGTYSLLVETKEGYWLAADTITVYNETLSYRRIGNQLRYRR